jgi:ubiquinone/menaquinone biosynthesis C-methylase UbiE
MKSNIEHLNDDVFGQTFAMYDKEEMIRFIEPFKIRFEKNKLDPYSLFKGKKCLDAGCGNGRGSIFMAMHGAAEIQSIDISLTNIESVKRNAEIFGYSDIINVQQSSLEKIPFDGEEFDFVWCNGVLMHTHNPDACLKELARVLKIDGKSWIYVYGAGGVYWYCVYKFREILQKYSEEQCINAMKFAQVPVSFLAEYMDDWKAPYLRTYTHDDFSRRLKELGFINIDPLPYGNDYDTSHRVNKFKNDALYLGDGDLRYLLTKNTNNLRDEHPISDSVFGSHYNYPDIYTNPLDEKFDLLEQEVGESLVLKILTCAYLQRNLRDNIFSTTQPFTLEIFLNYFDDAVNLLRSIK